MRHDKSKVRVHVQDFVPRTHSNFVARGPSALIIFTATRLDLGRRLG